jgi:serine/threonine protein kinase
MAGTGWNPDALSGARLGSCILEDPLSIGSMGAVFLARQERPHRYVAVKVIHRHLARDPEAWKLFLTRFQREADATAALDHANIVPIYEFGETGDVAYLVMPYLPDGSLATLISEHGPLAVPLAITYLEQVAAALDYAHARGIVHRDVKPSNMLLHPDGRILLADFGIARPLDLPELTRGSPVGGERTAGSETNTSLTQAGSSMGTPEFMAPEQVRGSAITPATDTYALGVAVYEMLAGETPFGGGDVTAVLRRQLVSPPPPLRTTRSDISPRMEEVIFWALAKDPADRPASAGQFAKALRAATRKGTLASSVGWLRQTPALPIGPRGSVSPGPLLSDTGSMRRMPELTVPLPQSVLPRAPIEAETTDGRTNGENTAVTAGPSGIQVHPALLAPVVGGGGEGYGGGYPEGVPQWPAPQRGPNKRVVITAVAGLVTAIVLLVVLAAVLANTVQAVLTPSSTPGASVSGSPGAHLPTPLPTTTPVPTATTVINSLSVSPSQITLSCGQKQTIRLTNDGTNSVDWRATVESTSGLFVRPTSGSLDAGETRTISITSFHLVGGSEGIIQFQVVSDQQAGSPAEVSYSITPCG